MNLYPFEDVSIKFLFNLHIFQLIGSVKVIGVKKKYICHYALKHLWWTIKLCDKHYNYSLCEAPR